VSQVTSVSLAFEWNRESFQADNEGSLLGLITMPSPKREKKV